MCNTATGATVAEEPGLCRRGTGATVAELPELWNAATGANVEGMYRDRTAVSRCVLYGLVGKLSASLPIRKFRARARTTGNRQVQGSLLEAATGVEPVMEVLQT